MDGGGSRGGIAMWARLTFVRAHPVELDVARQFYTREVSRVLREQPGHRFHYLLESLDHPGEFISLTVWNSQADAEAYEKSGAYAEMVEQFKEWFAAPPLLRSYLVRE